MTRNEFVDQWKYHITGICLFQQASEVKEAGTLTRAHRIHDLPKMVEELLGRMYDGLAKKLVPPQPLPVNGKAEPQPKVTK